MGVLLGIVRVLRSVESCYSSGPPPPSHTAFLQSPLDAKKAQEKLKEEHGEDWTMLLIQDERQDNTQAAQYSFLRFPHPRHGKDVLFVHANNNGTVHYTLEGLWTCQIAHS